MINSIIAYDVAEVGKRAVLSQAEELYKSKLLSEEQWLNIRKEFASNLYTPSIFMKAVFFIFFFIGLTTLVGPFAQMFKEIGMTGYRILSIILGVLILWMIEKISIKKNHHFKSGEIEAGIYSSLSLIAFAILGPDPSLMILAIVGFLLAALAAIRYLDLLSLVIALGFFGWLLFQTITAMGPSAEVWLPFLFMATSGMLYWGSKKLQLKLNNLIFDHQFVTLQSIALLLFYASGNYFVVREISISLMGLQISSGEDIPFAMVFYLLTTLVPLGYLYRGIRQKSISWIRMGLFTMALTVVTFKYYFLLAYPMLTVTILGAFMMGIALVFFNFLKQARGGFTREVLLHDKWQSSDLMALIASQTLGGNKMEVPADEDVIFKGGSFGGAGAGGNW